MQQRFQAHIKPTETPSASNAEVELSFGLLPRLAALINALGLREHHALSDYSASNFWLFRQAHEYRFIDGDWPHLRGCTYDRKEFVLPLFKIAEATEDVWRRLMADGVCAFPITEADLPFFDTKIFSVSALEEDGDYLYPASQFREYPGEPLRNQRSQTRRFTSSHRVETAVYGREHESAMRSVLEGWLRTKHHGDAFDGGPCLEALQSASELRLSGFVYWVDGEPAAFILGERIAIDVIVIRFIKALKDHVGIVPFVLQHASREWSDVRWFNLEQDLGLPNLRRMKQSYRPALLLMKYRLSLTK